MNERTPILRIDLASERPAYEQIVSGLRMLLVSGKFQPPDRLPSVRQLAVDLGVHHNTVAEAYRVLAEEGWLKLNRGRGAIVADRRGPKPTPEAEEKFRRVLEELVAKAIAEGVPRPTVVRRILAVSRKLA